MNLQVSNLVTGAHETHATQNILFDMAGVPQATPVRLFYILSLLSKRGRRSWTESKERKLKKLLQKVLSQEITQKVL